MDAAKRSLAKVTPRESEKDFLEKATEELDKGKEAIRIRQKHIRIADRSDWGVVAEYEADELADDSADEKKLYRAKKERYSKKRRNAQDNAPRKCSRPESSSRVAAPVVDVQPRGPPPKTRLLGQCYNCNEYGHLARACTKIQRLYPLSIDSIVKDLGNVHVCGPGDTELRSVPKVEKEVNLVFTACDEQLTCQPQGVNNMVTQDVCVDSASECSVSQSVQGVDNARVSGSTGDQEVMPIEVLVDGSSQNRTLLSPASFTNDKSDLCETNELEFSRSWEAEEQQDANQQVLDVQGRLKKSVKFWAEVLHAPAPVLEWIRDGYKLPLLYAPAPY